MARRQIPNETFKEYFNDVLRFRNQQKNLYSEWDLVEIMRGNLNSSLSHLLFSVTTEGLNDFCELGKRAENLLASHKQSFVQRSPKVHGIDLVRCLGVISAETVNFWVTASLIVYHHVVEYFVTNVVAMKWLHLTC